MAVKKTLLNSHPVSLTQYLHAILLSPSSQAFLFTPPPVLPSGFDKYMKEVGGNGSGMALRKVGAMAKPDCIISSDGKNLTIKTESTLKTTQFSCNLGEKFEETTADGRKTQTVCNFTDGTLVQHQEWDGKESTITRKLEDGKLVVECVMNNVTCTRIYEKVE
nr:LOW QUALITY PROTEIN: putative fatty acid-binding protein 5-like protein 3 [Vulpes vulpes]